MATPTLQITITMTISDIREESETFAIPDLLTATT